MAAWPVVQVFISSTFSAMHAERDHLVKRVFPEVRERLEAHSVDVVDIDLRWGITEEQAAQGRVSELCLHEIDASRPFFVGMLGERYGQTLSVSRELRAAYSWIASYSEMSTTELELRHAVLNRPDRSPAPLVCLRDHGVLGEIPATLRDEV